MGHRHSTLHSQLKQQDGGGPNCDLVTAPIDGASTSGGNSGLSVAPYLEVKKGPFKRRLSMRSISIRRSFHKPKKNSTRIVSEPTTASVVQTSSCSNSNGASAACSSALASNGSTLVRSNSIGNGHAQQVTMLPRSSKTGEKVVMDRIRKSFRNSFRRKKDHIPESIKPHQWQTDEMAVKSGTCMFPVKYLGCVEVFDSRGMQICEDALRRLRNSRRRAIKATLYVTGDGLRVVDNETKGLLLDQTIEKVSFCAPDRSHERGFSYICRDGTTRRWMCHGFHASKDSGERLSHAVGCAFGVCLERKQRRDKEAVNSVFDAKTATFTRTGSFRQSTITERMQDPQVAKAAEPPPIKPVHNPYAVERPHAAPSLLQRQGSLRGGPLNHASPFKRQLSLRMGVDTLPLVLSTTTATTKTNTVNTASSSNASVRERAHSLDFTSFENDNGMKRSTNSKVTLAPSVAPIEELSPSIDKANPLIENPTKTEGTSDTIMAMCQELSKGLSMLASKTEDWSTKNESANTFSAFDKWISGKSSEQPTNSITVDNSSKILSNNKVAVPLVPPLIVDQMPQVNAPPPPESPSYTSTVNFSIPPPPLITKKSQKFPSVNGIDTEKLSDPFDAGWAELTNSTFKLETNNNSTITTASIATTTVTPTPTITTINNTIPFKSTNPFLDLSQYTETAQDYFNSDIVEQTKSSNTNTTTTTAATTISTKNAAQQLFTAFEVSM